MAQAEANQPAGTQRIRTQSTGASTLVSEQGKTTIASTVVAKLVGLAAREVDGIYQLVASGTGAALSTFAQRVTGSSNIPERGVIVAVGEREAAVDLNVQVVYGASIPQVVQALRQNVIDRVRAMTGLSVTEININVVDLYFPGEERQQQPQELPPPPARRVE